ncbi:MAG TPA: CocE/NonD family hydrolase [Candidatus Melainabacteria bacterium]|nr:CocE/NonD family hydrolase [Candidatus Melainabacteria bacterium]HIN64365.1 CocE/NonD family hydrolase [Candidatus Obscuribacterales bacterium]
MQNNGLLLLIVLGTLFILRVLGQLLVAVFHVGFLPPMEDWMSGAISYPLLLSLQFCIIALMLKICIDLHRKVGFFARPNVVLGKFLLEGGKFYLFTMILRFVLRMALYPHERWFGGSLPIAFHCVLALFVLVWADCNLRASNVQILKSSWRAVMCRCFAIACILCWVGYELAPKVMAHNFHLRPAQYAVRIESNVPIQVATNVKLLADIYHPQHLDRCPTILVRIPYTKTPRNMLTANIIGRLWAERGYTAVIQCTRGRGGSGGSYYPLAHDRDDGIETLRWISKQRWYDQRIVGWGGSAFGHSQWAIADQASPGFIAMHVYESSTDIYRMFHPGGAFSLYSALAWAVTCHGQEDLLEWPKPQQIADFADIFPMRDADLKSTGLEIDFFNDWVNHSNRDAYWHEIDGHQRNQTLMAPSLLMCGWYDPFLPTQLSDFRNISEGKNRIAAQKSKLVIGPWIHGDELIFPGGFKPSLFRPATLAISLDWFDHILLGRSLLPQLAEIPAGQANVPPLSTAPIQIFVMGRNVWRAENEWPLARTRYTSFFLNRKELSLVKPNEDQSPSQFIYDPKNPVPTAGGAMIGRVPAILEQNVIESRSDVLCFTSKNLETDVEVTGPVKAELYISTDAPSTDFTAKLVDVHPNGVAYNICDGIRRVKSIGSGSVERVEIELWPTSMVFFKDHRLRLEISSSNFPRYDRNPNTGGVLASECNVRKARQRVFHDRQNPSRLILPIIPRAR